LFFSIFLVLGKICTPLVTFKISLTSFHFRIYKILTQRKILTFVFRVADQGILASGLGLGLQITLQICGFYESLPMEGDLQILKVEYLSNYLLLFGLAKARLKLSQS
jgi:hypothetical protein